MGGFFPLLYTVQYGSVATNWIFALYKYGVFMNWSLGSDPMGESTYSRVRRGAHYSLGWTIKAYLGTKGDAEDKLCGTKGNRQIPG